MTRLFKMGTSVNPHSGLCFYVPRAIAEALNWGAGTEVVLAIDLKARAVAIKEVSA